ncbi:MAG: DivIVA domain-containing protein [Nitriliruptorales bacterium]|nr:DivIVA domain-containing protein [Nitriliruptorales bacterium]
MHTPEEIASRQFLISLRGYDRGEVEDFLRQIADEVGALQARIRELEEELEAAPAKSEMQPAAQAPGTAPVESDAHPFKALGEETTRILVAAEESAQEIRRRAEERARHEVDQARREAREEVQGARRTASKIVADAERRRNGIAEDIRQLEATRDDLMHELREAMKGVQGAVRGLASTSGTTELAAGDAGAMTDQEASETDATEGDAEVADETPPDASDDDSVERLRRAVAPQGPESDDDVVADNEHIEPETTTAAALEEDRDDVEAVAAAVAAAPTTDEIDVDEALEIASFASSVGEEETARGEDQPEAESAADEESADEDHSGGADLTETDEAEDTDDQEDTDEEPEPARPIALRDESLAGIRPGMLRRLKRALQDVQNVVLDAIRRSEGKGEVDDLIPPEEELETLGEVATMFLTAAYRAGLADGAELVDEEVPEDGGDESRVSGASATFRAVLQHEINSSLAATLRAGLEAEEPETSLSERVGGVFRDLKGPVVEATVNEHLTRVYGYGAVDIWKELGAVDSKSWITGQEPRCPANQCQTNQREGPVALSEKFPSGDEVPPAHDACVCAVTPG